VVKADKVEKI